MVTMITIEIQATEITAATMIGQGGAANKRVGG
jgi:hypothetical protein